MNTPIRCVVTGGAGFIGSHLIDELLSRGYEVWCLDNLITGKKRNIVHLQSHPYFHFHEFDITKSFTGEIERELTNIRFVFHLASPASPPEYQKHSIETLLVNSIGTYHMLELARQEKARILIASTSEIYGDPLEHPQKESYHGNVNPVGVRACYDEAKRFSEAITMEYVRKHKVDARIMRIFNTYGPRMDPHDGRVISNFINQAIRDEPITIHGDGKQTRSFCFVTDLVEGIFLFMEKEGLQGEVANLGYPKEHAVNEIATIVRKLTKSLSPITHVSKLPDDPKRRRPDITKAKKLFGWEPKTSLLDGLKETITYYRSL